jgi:hypothetical protein
MDEEGRRECPRCGANAWETHRLPFYRALRVWLGRTSLDPWSWPRREAVCGRCGYRQELSAVPSFRPLEPVQPPPWWHVPHLVLRAVIRRRRSHPYRFIYVAAAAVGTMLGALLDLAFGWPWWTLALGAPVVLWLLITLPALRPSASPRTLWTEVLRSVQPARALELEERRFHAILRSPPFPLYGLTGKWTGVRFAGGHTWQGGEGITSISLGHGNPFDLSTAQVHVEVSRETHPLPREFRLRELTEGLWPESDVPPQEVTTRIPVDGMVTPFDVIVEGNSWAAVTEIEGLTVTVRGVNYPPDDVELVRVTDVEPYIDGSRWLAEESRREHS